MNRTCRSSRVKIIELVRTPSPKNRTPFSKFPSVTPVHANTIFLPGARQKDGVCVYGRDGRKFAEGGAIFRRRCAHQFDDFDPGRAASAVHRFGALGEEARCQGTLLLRKVGSGKKKELNESHSTTLRRGREAELSIGNSVETNHKLPLIVGDGQEDAVIHGDRTRKERGSFRAGHGHVSALATERGTSRMGPRPGAITGLERNA